LKPRVVCTDGEDKMFANSYKAFVENGFEYKPMQYEETRRLL